MQPRIQLVHTIDQKVPRRYLLFFRSLPRNNRISKLLLKPMIADQRIDDAELVLIGRLNIRPFHIHENLLLRLQNVGAVEQFDALIAGGLDFEENAVL